MRILVPDGADFSRQPGTDTILEILKKYKTIAVVGLSSNPMRPSFGVTEYMQGKGYRIIPVNPNETEVLGEKSYPRLEDVPEKIEIVNVFRRRRKCRRWWRARFALARKWFGCKWELRMKRRRQWQEQRSWWWLRMLAFWWNIEGERVR